MRVRLERTPETFREFIYIVNATTDEPDSPLRNVIMIDPHATRTRFILFEYIRELNNIGSIMVLLFESLESNVLLDGNPIKDGQGTHHSVGCQRLSDSTIALECPLSSDTSVRSNRLRGISRLYIS